MMAGFISQLEQRAGALQIPAMVLLGCLYFSLNTLAFPHGISGLLLFGMVAAPYIFLISNKYRLALLTFFALGAGQIIVGVHPVFYVRSTLLFFGFLAIFFLFVRFIQAETNMHRWMIFFGWFNLGMLAVYLALRFTPFQDLAWWTFFLSYSVGSYTRLKGFTYEPSYYAFMLVPFILYLINLLLTKPFRFIYLVILIGLLAGVAFAFSLGVLMGLALSIGMAVVYFLATPWFYKKNRWLIAAALGFALLGGMLVAVAFPESALVVRLHDLVAGKDISANSRLYDSFRLSFRLLDGSSIWFGLGPGQLKWKSYLEIKNYYHYFYMDVWSPAMPNTTTDWLCSFGILGLGIKLVLEVYYFLKMRVFTNFFRLSCFLFMFIYQFTGGFLFSIPELVLWALAFTPFQTKEPALAQ